MERVILLNRDFTFLNIISWKRAMCLIVKGKVEILKHGEKSLKLLNGSLINLPSVVKLVTIVRSIHKGKIPYSKKNVMIRDNFKCAFCGTNNDLTIDHIIPKIQGGKTCFENCITACRPCNLKKGSRTPKEANIFLNQQPYIPTISEFFRKKMKYLKINDYLKDIGVY